MPEPITLDTRRALAAPSLARAHDTSPVSGSSGRTFGAVLRQLRLEYGLSTRRLAGRSTLSRRAIQYFEDGSIRPRRGAIGALAYGLEPDEEDRRKQIIAELIAAAGGEHATAPDHHWPRYRARRFERGLLDGSVPWPADIARRITAHQRAGALRSRAWAVLGQPGALNDADALDRAHELLCEARRLDDIGGGLIILHIGKRVLRYGFGA